MLQRTCKEMFEDLLGKLDTSKYVWPPPKEIPTELYNEYSLDGRVQAGLPSSIWKISPRPFFCLPRASSWLSFEELWGVSATQAHADIDSSTVDILSEDDKQLSSDTLLRLWYRLQCLTASKRFCMQISNWYFSQQYNKNPEPHKWTKEVMEGFKSKAMKKEEFSYGAETNYIYDVLDQFSVAGDMGIVLGSEAPWIEGILLAKGALDLIWLLCVRHLPEHFHQKKTGYVTRPGHSARLKRSPGSPSGILIVIMVLDHELLNALYWICDSWQDRHYQSSNVSAFGEAHHIQIWLVRDSDYPQVWEQP